jgi:hypothetical protein
MAIIIALLRTGVKNQSVSSLGFDGKTLLKERLIFCP